MNFLKKLFQNSKLNKELLPQEPKEQPVQEDINKNEKPGEKKKIIDEPLSNSIEVPIELKKREYSEKEKNKLLYLIVDEEYLHRESKLENVPAGAEGIDPLLEEAARLIILNQIGSASLIQRRLKTGYNRAGHLMDQLEVAGIVGPNQGSKAREVLIKTEADLFECLKKFNLKFFKEKEELEEFKERYKEELEKWRNAYRVLKIEEQEKLEKEQIKTQLLEKQRLLEEKQRKNRLEKEAMEELIKDGVTLNQLLESENRREPISQEIMDQVWNRDGGRCVKCGSQKNLEFDHIIPFSKGGANTYRNLQLLCKNCNIEKSNKIG